MPKRGQTRGLSKQLRGVVARNVRRLMDQYGLSNEAVAHGAGVGHKTVYRILVEKISTTLDTLEAVATFLDVPAYQLLIEHQIPKVESDKRERFRHPHPQTFPELEYHPGRRRTNAVPQRSGKSVRQTGRK